MAICGLAVGFASVFGLMLWFSMNNAPAKVAVDEPPQTPSLATGDTATNGRAPASGRPGGAHASDPTIVGNAAAGGGAAPISSSRPVTVVQPRGPSTLADLMQPDDGSTIDVNTVTGKMAAARRAMWSRDLDAAGKHVEAAGQIARTPTERDEVQRVSRLLDSLSAFWTAVRETASRLEGVDELDIGGTIALVVEASPQELTVRAAGRNLTYAVDELPGSLAVALAERRLPRGRATTDLSIGAFLAVDAGGDRGEARTRWEQAGADGKALLVELTLAPPVRSPESAGSASPVAGMLNDTPLGSLADEPQKPPVLKRDPIPEAGALTRAEAEIRELFGNDLENARTSEEKKSLADKLLAVAIQTDDDPAAVYVLCRIARDKAVDAGDPECFCRIIDAMGQRYDVDALGMKAEAVATAWRTHNEAEVRMALARQSLDLLEAAMRANHYEAATEFVRAAQYGARGAKNFTLVRELEQKERQIKASLRKGE
ncbi:MAG: hypothetical protein HQ582_33860 [Planctomycetes bacterium]|nr:hypothetical protein [Planctomycetota bacterium]